MRLLLTTDTIGGVWTFTRDLTTELLSRGHAVALLSFGHLPRAPHRSWAATQAAKYGENFRFVHSNAPLEWMQENDRSRDGLVDLLTLCTVFHPDLIHSNQFCFGNLPISIPVVVTAHSDVLSWASACQPQGLHSTPWLDRYKCLVEDGLTGAAAVVAPTRWMLEALRANFTFSADAHVILNGRNLPLAPTNEPRNLQAVCAGRLWDPAKGSALLTRVQSPIPIDIAGDAGDEDAFPSTGTSPRYLGTLDEEELLTLFRASSLYLAPSLYEPFGLAPLEAALCGCAVVARDIPSLREVWGDAALFFHTEEEFTSLLNLLASSPDFLFEARMRAGRHAQALTATRMTRQYIALYEQLIGPQLGSNSATAQSPVTFDPRTTPNPGAAVHGG